MPRRGQNPAKSIDRVAQPERVTIALVTYIPFLQGYYQQSLDVLRVCIQSVLSNTLVPYDLLVFDNASCPEVVSYLFQLHSAGEIDYLVLSEKNLGKVGAWNMIFQGAPGEFIAYADSDIYFFPGWLAKHLEVMETFPDVGTVSGLPRRQRHDFCEQTHKRVREMSQLKVQEGKLIPEAWIMDHARSLNKLDSVRQDLDRMDTRVTYKGVSAYVTAAHFQFLVRKDAVKPFLPFSYSRPMGPDVAQFDRAIDGDGMLRLAVDERLVYHIGNVYDEVALAKIISDGSSAGLPRPGGTKKRGLLHRGPIKKLLLRLYNWIFQLYSE